MVSRDRTPGSPARAGRCATDARRGRGARGRDRGVTPALACAALLALAACAVNPATGERQFMLISESREIEMGRDADPQIVASYGLVDDAELQAYVSELGLRMARQSERPDLPWSFKVVDDPIVNAFALPGGFIYVSRGILAHFDSEAELAGVLGHEIAHVTARHSAAQMSSQVLTQAALGIGMAVWEPARRYGQFGAAALQLMDLRYSRSNESESDRFGLAYMTAQGYDPDEMIGVFDMLANVGGGAGSRLPEWQLTHPYPENREADMRALIAEQGLPRSGRVNQDDYLEAIDGLVYGPNPREGYFRGQRFFHPDLSFELTFPEDWTTVNQRTVVAGISEEENAVLTIEIVPDGSRPTQELRDFLRGEGVSGGTPSEGTVRGIERAMADFSVTSDGDAFDGRVAFLRMNNTTYRVMGYGTESAWRDVSGDVADAIDSFARVREVSVLNVQPLTIEITRITDPMSLTRFHEANSPPISLEELGLLNRRAPNEVLPAGSRVKTVAGELPR